MSQFEYNLVDKFYQLYHKSLDDSIFILAYFQKKKKKLYKMKFEVTSDYTYFFFIKISKV